MVMVLEPIVSKAVFNHVSHSFVDDKKFITDILSMDGKVSLYLLLEIEEINRLKKL